MDLPGSYALEVPTRPTRAGSVGVIVVSPTLGIAASYRGSTVSAPALKNPALPALGANQPGKLALPPELAVSSLPPALGAFSGC